MADISAKDGSQVLLLATELQIYLHTIKSINDLLVDMNVNCFTDTHQEERLNAVLWRLAAGPPRHSPTEHSRILIPWTGDLGEPGRTAGQFPAHSLRQW